MRGRSGISVGLCGDPDLITTAIGGSPDDPCPNSMYGTGVLCNNHDTKAWLSSATELYDQVTAAWNVLVATEDRLGVSSEQLRLEELMDNLSKTYRQFPDDGSGWFYQDNTELVIEIISWMTTAACRLEEINRAIRKYKIQPPSNPTPGPTSGTVPSYVPTDSRAPTRDKPATQKVGETTLVLLGVGLLVGGAYLYAKGKTRGLGSLGGLGRRSRSPLPPRK